MPTQKVNLKELTSPVLLQGDSHTAYRDPAVVYDKGVFYLFHTLVITEENGDVYMYAALSESSDLRQFAAPRILTPRDRNLNFSSPGNIIRHNGKWLMCLQTYPRPNGEKYATGDARLWTMQSDNLKDWETPQIIMAKGNAIPRGEMGRMIDPYLLEDKDAPGKYWCFYKQNGVSMSYSHDLVNWTYYGNTDSGENVCVLVENGEYILFHSPANGIGVMRSKDLKHWVSSATRITLGQKHWEWARGRLTAGFVLDCRHVDEIGKYLMFFHGTGPEKEDTVFDTHACIGVSWSDDLNRWSWPGK